MRHVVAPGERRTLNSTPDRLASCRMPSTICLKGRRYSGSVHTSLTRRFRASSSGSCSAMANLSGRARKLPVILTNWLTVNMGMRSLSNSSENHWAVSTPTSWAASSMAVSYDAAIWRVARRPAVVRTAKRRRDVRTMLGWDRRVRNVRANEAFFWSHRRPSASQHVARSASACSAASAASYHGSSSSGTASGSVHGSFSARAFSAILVQMLVRRYRPKGLSELPELLPALLLDDDSVDHVTLEPMLRRRCPGSVLWTVFMASTAAASKVTEGGCVCSTAPASGSGSGSAGCSGSGSASTSEVVAEEVCDASPRSLQRCSCRSTRDGPVPLSLSVDSVEATRSRG
mmetsp:Transcript_27403/g.64257  ORF Transcript_27403/g.64257 Transcript_27403/m.64257 type:complete len:345 (-) Transcript_27403:260-1294(-)